MPTFSIIAKDRNPEMNVVSLVSRVATTETANDRRLAIQNAWSIKELAQRHQNAIDLQFRLAGLILIGAQKKSPAEEKLELAS
jgi:hypothetical protein